MAYHYHRRMLAKDLGFAALSFGAGWTLQELENFWYAYQTGQHAYFGESVDGFVGYWSPVTSPWNFLGLLTGIGLSLVPKKEGSKHATARTIARVAGHAIMGAEGWGYAQHNQQVGAGAGTVVFASGIQLSPVSGVPAGTIPRDAVRPGTSFYRQPGVPGTQAGAQSGPKNFF